MCLTCLFITKLPITLFTGIHTWFCHAVFYSMPLASTSSTAIFSHCYGPL